jgi:hypothetical protein
LDWLRSGVKALEPNLTSREGAKLPGAMAGSSQTPEMPWLESVRHASLDWRPPMAPSEWEAMRPLLPLLPPDLRALYQEANGVRLPSGLKIFPLRGKRGEVSALLQSSETRGSWQFGRVGERVRLFATQKKQIRSSAGKARLTQWWQDAREDTWVYGIRHDTHPEIRLFPSLPSLLKALLPGWLEPAAAEVEPAFAQSADVQLLDSDSIDIQVDESAAPPKPPEEVMSEPISDRWILEESALAASTTEKVNLPAGKRTKRRKKPSKARKARRRK